MLTLSEKAIVDYLGVMNHVAPGGYGAFLARHSRFWLAAAAEKPKRRRRLAAPAVEEAQG